MNVKLQISTATNVANASTCPKHSESFCGIMYRAA